MSTRSIRSPFAFAVHRLATTPLGALLKLILMWASISTVQCSLADLVDSAALILMIPKNILTLSIITPGSYTVHWLSTFLSSALLKLMSVWASITVLSSSNCNLVQSATLVLVGILVVSTGTVLIPGANTVHWLSASTNCALHVVVSI